MNGPKMNLLLKDIRRGSPLLSIFRWWSILIILKDSKYVYDIGEEDDKEEEEDDDDVDYNKKKIFIMIMGTLVLSISSCVSLPPWKISPTYSILIRISGTAKEHHHPVQKPFYFAKYVEWTIPSLM